jgi:septal ring factor EnvC (AmiA/AmiB activator)
MNAEWYTETMNFINTNFGYIGIVVASLLSQILYLSVIKGKNNKILASEDKIYSLSTSNKILTAKNAKLVNETNNSLRDLENKIKNVTEELRSTITAHNRLLKKNKAIKNYISLIEDKYNGKYCPDKEFEFNHLLKTLYPEDTVTRAKQALLEV